MPTSENSETPDQIKLGQHEYLGEPNCPICHGIGFIRQNLAITDPDFGKMKICACRKKNLQENTSRYLFEDSNLEALQRYTFESFNLHGRTGLTQQQILSLQIAHSHSIQFAQFPKGWLLLAGKCGCGKTHLAAAIANYAVNIGIPTQYISVPNLLDWLRFSYDKPESSFEKRFEEIRNINLLVLDDLGTQNATAWAQEKLFQIINHRYTRQIPTVIVTDLELTEIEDRIRSRLEDPELVSVVRITAPDYRSPTQEISSRPLLSSLALHSKQTFGNFSLRDNENRPSGELQSLSKAYKAAQKYAEKPEGWLLLMGDSGIGKTHLAAAIGNHNLSNNHLPVFVVVPDLLDHLRSTFNPSSQVTYDRLFDEVRSTSLLILDDLGMQSATAWAREKLYQLLNHRYSAELPTVITTSLTMDDFDKPIRTRLMDTRLCKTYKILLPPYTDSGSLPASASKSGRKRSSFKD